MPWTWGSWQGPNIDDCTSHRRGTPCPYLLDDFKGRDADGRDALCASAKLKESRGWTLPLIVRPDPSPCLPDDFTSPRLTAADEHATETIARCG
jgi:hypothetical protein